MCIIPPPAVRGVRPAWKALVSELGHIIAQRVAEAAHVQEVLPRRGGRTVDRGRTARQQPP